MNVKQPLVRPTVDHSRTTSPGGVPLVRIENPDYVVQPQDKLWDVAAALVKEQGGKVTDTSIANALRDLEKLNPQLFTAERKEGSRIFPGDHVRFPTKEGGWKFGASTKPPAPQTDAAADMERLKREAEEQQQRMRDNREQTLIRHADFASKNELTPSQKDAILEHLQEVEAEAPDMLDFPHVRDLAKKVGFVRADAEEPVAAPAEDAPAPAPVAAAPAPAAAAPAPAPVPAAAPQAAAPAAPAQPVNDVSPTQLKALLESAATQGKLAVDAKGVLTDPGVKKLFEQALDATKKDFANDPIVQAMSKLVGRAVTPALDEAKVKAAAHDLEGLALRLRQAARGEGRPVTGASLTFLETVKGRDPAAFSAAMKSQPAELRDFWNKGQAENAFGAFLRERGLDFGDAKLRITGNEAFADALKSREDLLKEAKSITAPDSLKSADGWKSLGNGSFWRGQNALEMLKLDGKTFLRLPNGGSFKDKYYELPGGETVTHKLPVTFE